MAKVATVLDHSQLPTTGKWIWKEDLKCLEFQSNNPNADRQDKRRKAKESNKRNERVTSSVARSHTRGRQGRGNPPKSPRQTAKQPAEDAVVTIECVKNVSMDMVTEAQEVHEVFDGLFQTEQFDVFLLHVLSYFHCFFEKMTQENKLKQSTYIEPSLSEKKAYADACAKLEVVQKLLGQSYCVLVLGLGLENQHHMVCGLSRVSSTYKDRDMYEDLYSFCTKFVWVAFRKKELEVIGKEIGRMLRSDTFNPAIRVKNAPDEKELKEQKKENKEGLTFSTEKKISPAEYRRLHPKRPAIKSIINQRSPAVVSILPSPKEESHWLFRRPRTLSPKSRGKISQDGEEDDTEEDQMMMQVPVINKNMKVGILGEPRKDFNEKLTPLGAENEDEENEGEEGAQKESAEEAGAEKTPSPERGLSRQQTAVSQVTTEAYSDNEE